jgi:hypothetical protein
MPNSTGAAAPHAPGPSLAIRLLLLAVSCVLAAGVAELAVRLVLPQPLVEGDHFYAADAELGWTNAANFRGRLSNLVDFDVAIRTDSLGLRGPEINERRPRVLGLGDSFMFGYGVEENDTFLAQAATVAGAAPLNGGVPGYDLCQAVDLGERLLRSADADALVLGICLANDEWDAGAGRGRMEVRQGYFVEPGSKIDPSSLWRRLRHPVFAHSHLVRFLRFSPVSEVLARTLVGKESIDKRALQGLLWAYEAKPPAIILAGDRITAPCLRKLHQLGDAHHIAVVAELLPDELEIVPGRVERAGKAAGLDDVRWDVDGPRRRFTAMLNQAGIAVVDPTAELRAAAAKGAKLYFTRDRHFNPAGARIAGEALGRMLRQAWNARRVASASLTPHAPS